MLVVGDLRVCYQGVPPGELPERWSFVDEVPKTSVGKFDKRTLRARHARAELDVHLLGPRPEPA